MIIKTEIIFEGEDGCFTVNLSGRVQKHYGYLEVSEFESDVDLTMDEKEQAIDRLLDFARAACGYFPEEEPDARRPR